MTIAYLNVATDRQHLDIQREEISSFAAAKDIHVDKWVMEVSGEKAKQPGPKLKLVLERLKKGDALIVSDITRLNKKSSGHRHARAQCVPSHEHEL